MEVRITPQLIIQIITTLKSLDVRGYESMDKLVGLVILFENMLNSAPAPNVPPEQMGNIVPKPQEPGAPEHPAQRGE